MKTFLILGVLVVLVRMIREKLLRKKLIGSDLKSWRFVKLKMNKSHSNSRRPESLQRIQHSVLWARFSLELGTFSLICRVKVQTTNPLDEMLEILFLEMWIKITMSNLSFLKACRVKVFWMTATFRETTFAYCNYRWALNGTNVKKLVDRSRLMFVIFKKIDIKCKCSQVCALHSLLEFEAIKK